MREDPFPSYSLVYTTARPSCVPGVLDQWFGRARKPDAVDAVVSVDAPDEAAAAMAVAASRWRGQTRLVVNRGPRTCVAGWNEAARHATGDVIIAVADDFEPPEDWDDALAACGPAGWWREDRVVAVADGNITDIFTLAILTRVRLQRFGYLFHPAYESLFSDTEYTAVACAERVALDGRHLLFEHKHHVFGKRAKDTVDRVHASRERWRRGERLFLARQRCGFPREPLDAAPVASPDAGELRFALYLQANKDDFCLAETARALLAQQVQGLGVIGAVFFFCPDEYWSGRATEPAERGQVEAVAAQLRQEWPGAEFHVVTQTIAPLRVAARSRLEVETRARNAALAEIRRYGYAHILVVDGDELWRPGGLRQLATHVRQHQPAALFSLVVPVVGLPGYPVQGATDQATVYLGPHASFVACRRVCGITTRLPGRGILHFTATRRTMAEIVAKHRESGHYGDPDYDFEGWIADVLPRIKPGLAGAHMYRPKQIWPRVRRWQAAEREAIPPTLLPYMGPETEPAWAEWFRRLRRFRPGR